MTEEETQPPDPLPSSSSSPTSILEEPQGVQNPEIHSNGMEQESTPPRENPLPGEATEEIEETGESSGSRSSESQEEPNASSSPPQDQSNETPQGSLKAEENAQSTTINEEDYNQSHSELTESVLLLVFRYLSPKELCSVACICKQWERISKANSLWLPLLSKHNWNPTCNLSDQTPSEGSMKELFKQKYVATSTTTTTPTSPPASPTPTPTSPPTSPTPTPKKKCAEDFNFENILGRGSYGLVRSIDSRSKTSLWEYLTPESNFFFHSFP
jgi:hypothetical protein